METAHLPFNSCVTLDEFSTFRDSVSTSANRALRITLGKVWGSPGFGQVFEACASLPPAFTLQRKLCIVGCGYGKKAFEPGLERVERRRGKERASHTSGQRD